jgi:phage terminase large subunit-like protein
MQQVEQDFTEMSYNIHFKGRTKVQDEPYMFVWYARE